MSDKLECDLKVDTVNTVEKSGKDDKIIATLTGDVMDCSVKLTVTCDNRLVLGDLGIDKKDLLKTLVLRDTNKTLDDYTEE